MVTNLTSGRRARRWAIASAGLALALAGCARDASQDIFQPEGDNARKIYDVQMLPFVLAGVVGVIVLAGVGYTVWRYRDRGQKIPHQSHGNPAIELGGILTSAAILAVISVPTLQGVFYLAKTSDCPMTVNVTGQQWWWEYSYPVQKVGDITIDQPIVTSGELVFPAGQCITLRITSRDVIHSYWIPKLNGKRDAVPGRVQQLRMEADHPGIYDGQCTEFCGLSHGNMKMDAVALTDADFQTWINQQKQSAPTPEPDSAAARGESIVQSQCVRCHQINGMVDADGNPVLSHADQNLVSGAAPNLTHLMSRTMFAGATFDLLTEKCRADLRSLPPEEFGAQYLKGVTPECLNRTELEEWLANAPGKKPMYPDVNAAGLGRGMPYLGLSEAQIDDIVAYLTTLNPSEGGNS